MKLRSLKRHLSNLFIPHNRNNHRPKILHHDSLSKLILILLFFQVIITSVVRTKPGILGYASNISVEAILSLTNAQRTSEGLEPLQLNTTLSDSARRKAAHMFSQNYWAHTAPDGTTPWFFFKNVGYNYLYAGENLARDFGDSSSVVQAWMDSPTHRDNIMSPKYNEIGIAVVNGLLNNQETTLVVQHFGKQASLPASVPQQSQPSQAQASVPEKTAPQPTEPSVAVAEPVGDVVEELIHEQAIGSERALPQSILPATLSQLRPVSGAYTVSAFDLTKSVNLSLTFVIIFVLVLDGYLIWRRKTERRAGKSFIHLSLFVLVALAILLTNSGKIL
ncbi:MAG: CAP domain-containing protein [Patescibacteria group bacterium]|jgi:hypothetical protein